MSKYDKASLVHIPSGYKSGTLYNVLPNDADGDFDFTRASTATRVDENGLIETIAIGTPRLNYPLLDGVVQDNPALLLEPQRTNLATYSQDFSDTSWNKVNSAGSTLPNVTSNYGISPDGTQNADRIQVSRASGAADFSSIYKSITTSSVNRALSVWLKSLSGTPTILIANNNGAYVSQQITTEWVRYELDLGVGTYTELQLSVVGSNFVQGVSESADFLAWGFQLEQGSYATSYIPTSGSSVTRSADAANGAGTAADFNDSEGVLYANIAALADEGIRQISINDNSSSDRVSIILGASSNQVIASTHVSGSDTNLYLNTTNNTTLYNKYAYKYKTNDFSFWINGFEQSATIVGGATFPDGTLANMDYDRGDGVYNFYGKTKEVIAFNEALSDIELETLTSYDSFNEMATEQLYTIE